MTTPEQQEEPTAWRERLDAEVLAQARAERENQQELARIDSQKAVKLEEILAGSARHQRERRGYILSGLAIVIVVVAVIAATWTGVDRNGVREQHREQLRQQTAQACIQAGNIWTSAGDCLITQRPPAANPAGAR